MLADRRGSFGIGENESKAIWGVVLAAIVFGGALDEDAAQKIGAAQRSFYPKPVGYEKVEAIKAKAKAKATRPRPQVIDESAIPR